MLFIHQFPNTLFIQPVVDEHDHYRPWRGFQLEMSFGEVNSVAEGRRKDALN